ncbi:MAG: CoA ester lyase [Acidiferrobacteraceae bacterium]|nr:CoA ester lyase [Acidiferrobacteraceae bacterium]|tara:strand:+ start:90 stop:950 length:861 start_codon:yes stop_codon:yes gene_type:complete
MTKKETPNIRARRSFIFCPALKPDLFPKAVASGADIVCIELEDGVAPKDKTIAREQAIQLFATRPINDEVELVLRINSPRSTIGIKDIDAILEAAHPPPAIMIPKIVSPDEVIWLDGLLTEANHNTRLHLIIETNAGLEAAVEIAQASARIDSLLFGGIDMAAELRCKTTWNPLLYARSRVVHAAANAGIDVIDVPYLDLDDLDGMKEEAKLAKELGFSGKGAIHPKQIAILNEAFTPTKSEVRRAQQIIEAFESGGMDLLVIDGKLIEKPVIREMKRILSISQNL